MKENKKLCASVANIPTVKSSNLSQYIRKHFEEIFSFISSTHNN